MDILHTLPILLYLLISLHFIGFSGFSLFSDEDEPQVQSLQQDDDPADIGRSEMLPPHGPDRARQTFLFIEMINKAENLRRGMEGIEATLSNS